MVLRDKEFHQHVVHFVICCDLVTSGGNSSGSSSNAPTVYSCWQVPQHLQQQHWTAVLTAHAGQLSERQLVLPSSETSQVLRVLSRFEAADFIHCYMPGRCPGLRMRKPAPSSTSTSPGVLAASGPASTGMVWHLPRCNLQFELSAAGSVVSLDHRGYSLNTQQLLVSGPGKSVSYTLPEFQQYLMLQAQQGSGSDTIGAERSDQLVLVPSGRVVMQRLSPGSEQRGASTRVQLSAECSDSVKVRGMFSNLRKPHWATTCKVHTFRNAWIQACSTADREHALIFSQPGKQTCAQS